MRVEVGGAEFRGCTDGLLGGVQQCVGTVGVGQVASDVSGHRGEPCAGGR